MTKVSKFLPIEPVLGMVKSKVSVTPQNGIRTYKMIESLEIKDFRCFDQVSIADLKRVNIVTGSNASGKTALFEAIYLGANATGSALQNVRMLRTPSQPSAIFVGGQGGFPTMALQQNNPANFETLFRAGRLDKKFSKAQKFEVSFVDSQKYQFNLTSYFQSPGGDQLVPIINFPGGAGTVTPLILHREKKDEFGASLEVQDIAVSVNQFGQLQQPFAAPFGPVTYIFGSGMDYSETDNVAWFSELKERGEAENIISFIRNEFPFIEDIEVLAPPPGINGLYATMTDGTRRRVTSVSSGIYKIISILLACAHAKDGIIVIDEIENGIFYEKYKVMWSILYKFALETGNQIFVSSHSLECLEAIVPTLTGNEDDFSLLRTESTGDKFLVTHISGQSMKSALKLGSEIRG